MAAVSFGCLDVGCVKAVPSPTSVSCAEALKGPASAVIVIDDFWYRGWHGPYVCGGEVALEGVPDEWYARALELKRLKIPIRACGVLSRTVTPISPGRVADFRLRLNPSCSSVDFEQVQK